MGTRFCQKAPLGTGFAHANIWVAIDKEGECTLEEDIPSTSPFPGTHCSALGERREVPMYRNILLAAALQRWDRYSAHALAAREVAGAMALSAAHQLHVLSVYDYSFKAPASGLPAEMVAKLREEDLRRTNSLMEQKVEDYIAPLKAIGLEVTTFLRVGDARSVIVQLATEIKPDALIIGSHSKRSFLDIALGGTAKYVSQHVSCTVILVSPEKQT